MAEDGDRHGFSGKITTGAIASGAVIDAEFVTLEGPIAVSSRPMPPIRDKSPAAGMEILRRAKSAEPGKGGPLFWTCGAVVVVGAFWISGGHALF